MNCKERLIYCSVALKVVSDDHERKNKHIMVKYVKVLH